MTFSRLYSPLLPFLVIGGLLGCQSVTSLSTPEFSAPITAPSDRQSEAPPTATAHPVTSTPTPVPSPTAIPTATPQPTPTPTPRPTITPTPQFTPPDGERLTTVGNLPEDRFWRNKQPFWLAGCHADISVTDSYRTSHFKPFTNSGRFRTGIPVALVKIDGYPPELRDKVAAGDLGCLVMRVRFMADETYCLSYFRFSSGCPKDEEMVIPRFVTKWSPDLEFYLKEISKWSVPAMSAQASGQ